MLGLRRPRRLREDRSEAHSALHLRSMIIFGSPKMRDADSEAGIRGMKNLGLSLQVPEEHAQLPQYFLERPAS